MSFESNEALGVAPIELYRFYKGGTILTYTSGDVTVSHNGESYVPHVIGRSDSESSEEIATNEMEISVLRSSPAAAWFSGQLPSQPVWVTIFRAHRDFPGDGVQELFHGQVNEGRFSEAEAVLKCQSEGGALRNTIPRTLYQQQCNNFLYDENCKVNPATYAVAGTIISIASTGEGRQTLGIVTGRPSGYFAGGVVLLGDERAFIEQQVGAVLTLMAPLTGAAVSAAVTLYPGCDRLSATCRVKFSNLVNFAGFPFIPQKNPFEELE